MEFNVSPISAKLLGKRPAEDGFELPAKRSCRGVYPNEATITSDILQLLRTSELPEETVALIEEWLVVLQTEPGEIKRFIELGLCYYLLNTRPEFAHDIIAHRHCFFDRVQREILHQCDSIDHNYETYCPDELKGQFPVGKINFVLREFAKIIFCDGRKFNHGGAQAVVQLLKSPIAAHIPEDQQMYILAIVERIWLDSALQDVFLNPPPPVESCQEDVRLSQQLRMGADLAPVDVQRAVLIAFFSPIVQIGDNGNCFAVAPAKGMQQCKLTLVAQILMETLRNGFFIFEGRRISINLLKLGGGEIPNCLSTPIHFTDEQARNLQHLEVFKSVACQIGEIDFQSVSGEKSSLIDYLNPFTDLGVVLASYDSLISSPLNQLLMKLLQFNGINCDNSTTRCELLDCLDKFFKKYLPPHLAMAINNWNSRTFIFIDIIHSAYKKSDVEPKIWFDAHRSLTLEAPDSSAEDEDEVEEEDYHEFLNERRLVALGDDNEITQIFTVDDLISILNHNIDRLSISRSENTDRIKRLVSQKMPERIMSFVERTNKNYPVELFQRSDRAIFLIADGGMTERILEKLGLIQGDPFEYDPSDPGSFIISLSDTMICYLQDGQRVPPNFFANLEDDEAHSLNVVPELFKELFENGTRGRDEYMAKILTAGQALKEQPITPEQQIAIRERLMIATAVDHPLEPLSFDDFLATLPDQRCFDEDGIINKSAAETSSVQEAISLELSKIPVEAYLEELDAILDTCQIEMNTTNCKQLLRERCAGHLKMEPYELAFITRDLLIQESIWVRSLELGKAISLHFRLPPLIPFALENGESNTGEKVEYQAVCVGYNVVTGDFDFFLYSSGHVATYVNNEETNNIKSFEAYPIT